ncbi:MAG: hypothetical protein ACJ8R9_05590 [Steroidobacteraceae bacterium]
MSDRIFGHTWEDIQRAQQGGRLQEHLPPIKPGQDYGANPMRDGTFQMVPSGDIVDLAERNRRLQR